MLGLLGNTCRLSFTGATVRNPRLDPATHTMRCECVWPHVAEVLVYLLSIKNLEKQGGNHLELTDSQKAEQRHINKLVSLGYRLNSGSSVLKSQYHPWKPVNPPFCLTSFNWCVCVCVCVCDL